MAARWRSLSFDIAWLLLTLLVGVITVPLLLLPRQAMRWLALQWAGATLWLAKHLIGIRYEVVGSIPRLRPKLIAARHESAYETILFMRLFPEAQPIIKWELLWIPIYGWATWKYGSIAIRRGQRVASIRRMQTLARQEIARGHDILVFPEGTRCPPGVAGTIQSGIAALYDATQLPVLPLAVTSGHVWPKQGYKRAGVVRITVQPMLPAALPRAALLQALQDALSPRAAGGGSGTLP